MFKISFIFITFFYLFFFKYFLQIYIHSADESIGQDLPPQHIWNRRVQKISFMPKATYTTEDTRQLSIRQRHCIFPDEVTLMTNDVYTFSACMAQCRMQISYDNCGCIPFFYKEIGNSMFHFFFFNL